MLALLTSNQVRHGVGMRDGSGPLLWERQCGYADAVVFIFWGFNTWLSDSGPKPDICSLLLEFRMPAGKHVKPLKYN
jgi:hypothetical protein